jgi:ketopantoate reductase
MWIKWLLMTSNAQGASYFNVTIGELREDKEKFSFVLSMMDEALAVAKAEKIPLDDDVREQLIKTIWTLAPQSQPSLSRDLYTPGKSTELDLFAGELKRLADKHHLPAPATEQMLMKFKDRL